MKKIVILGCENSHADAFLKCIRDKEELRDVEVLGVYSDNAEAAARLHEKYGVAVLRDFAEAVGAVDGVVITARHGDNHLKYAAPYINSGVPMFIDKPITIDEGEAVELARRLIAAGVRVSGGSSLKQDDCVRRLKEEAAQGVGGTTLGGYVRAPYIADSPYGGFYFYAQHLVEMVCEIFGRFPLSVLAREQEGQIHVLFRYGRCDCVGLLCNKNYRYFVSRMAQESETALPITATDDWFYREFSEFYGLLCGKEQEMSYEEFIAPVFVMNAVRRSLESGAEEDVRYPSLEGQV